MCHENLLFNLSDIFQRCISIYHHSNTDKWTNPIQEVPQYLLDFYSINTTLSVESHPMFLYPFSWLIKFNPLRLYMSIINQNMNIPQWYKYSFWTIISPFNTEEFISCYISLLSSIWWQKPSVWLFYYIPA